MGNNYPLLGRERVGGGAIQSDHTISRSTAVMKILRAARDFHSVSTRSYSAVYSTSLPNSDKKSGWFSYPDRSRAEQVAAIRIGLGTPIIIINNKAAGGGLFIGALLGLVAAPSFPSASLNTHRVTYPRKKECP